MKKKIRYMFYSLILGLLFSLGLSSLKQLNWSEKTQSEETESVSHYDSRTNFTPAVFNLFKML